MPSWDSRVVSVAAKRANGKPDEIPRKKAASDSFSRYGMTDSHRLRRSFGCIAVSVIRNSLLQIAAPQPRDGYWEGWMNRRSTVKAREMSPPEKPAGEHIAKLLARAGVASRREVERMIA